MAADLDEQVAAFRTRPLGDAGPFTFLAADGLTMKVRENGRVVNAVVVVATGVNADGHREEGRLLIAYVDFNVGESRMRVIQHITYDQNRRTLQARYLDTMGDQATYIWVYEQPEIRVSLGDADSSTYFRATLNDDKSRYIGTWHYPEGDHPDATENITYTRAEDER